MLDELHIAASYGHRVTVRLKDGKNITGKAQLSGDPNRAKIRTVDATVWVPYGDIDHVERLVKLH